MGLKVMGFKVMGFIVSGSLGLGPMGLVHHDKAAHLRRSSHLR